MVLRLGGPKTLAIILELLTRYVLPFVCEEKQVASNGQQMLTAASNNLYSNLAGECAGSDTSRPMMHRSL